MKRFLVVAMLLVVIVGVMLYFMPKTYEQALASVIPDEAIINIYGRNGSLQGVELGFGQMVSCSKDNFAVTYPRCGQIDGVSATFNGSVTDVQCILTELRVKVLSVQTLGELTVYCGISNSVRGSVMLEGIRVNCQIAYCNGVVTVGFPLILGDY